MEDYNYLSSYGDYGSPSQLISKKTVEDITANAPKEMDTFKEVADKISELEGGSGSSSADVEALTQTVEQNKAEADAKFEEIDNALSEKADASELASLADGIEYDSDAKKIYLKHGDDVLGEIDATQFIKDGMISNVEIDGTDLVITFNEDAGDKETIRLSLASIFDASNYVTRQDFDEHVAANEEAIASINVALGNKLDSNALDGYVQDANYVHTDNNFSTEEKDKLADLSNYDDTALTERVETIENANYVEDANYVHTDNNYSTDEKNKLGELDNYDDTELAGRVTALENANYVTTEMMNGAIDTATQGLISVETDPTVPEWAKAETKPTYTAAEVGAMSTEHPSNSITAEKMAAWDNKADSDTNTTVTGVDVINDDDEGRVLVINSSDDTSVSVSTSKIFDEGNYYTTTETDNIFVAKSKYEDDMELKADKSELGGYTTDSELANAVHDLVVRLNKLEAQNAVLVEKGTESADDINAMTPEEAASADIVVATDEAIGALSEPKTFNSISIAGGEVGDNTVINLLATDSVDVNGLTVSGTKGSGNGKIVYGTNDITISNMNIEPGCTVYNVFEGKQDQASENCVENFTATNIVVNDTDLAHNVFNIYQFNDGANVLIKDSSFNLDVANSNVLRVSNLTNAENVTITFENVDWNYEDKGYTDDDLKWAGLMIYQPYNTDAGSTGDTSHMQTWTINVKNCRYNGTPVTENEVGTIRQALYQYNVGGTKVCEDATAFGTVNFE